MALCAEQLLNLSSTIISNAHTKAKAIGCSSVPPFRHHHHMLVPSNVISASVVCSSSVNAQHEYFDPAGSSAPASESVPDEQNPRYHRPSHVM
jgi:hypothetical protein